MSAFTRKAFPPLPIGATNRSGSVNTIVTANRVNQAVSTKNRLNQYINRLKSKSSTRKEMKNAINRNINIRGRLNGALPPTKILQFSNTVTANNGSTRKIQNNKNTLRGKTHAFTQAVKPSIFNFSFLNPFARQKKANAAAYQNELRESRKSVPKSTTYTKFFGTSENRKEKRKWATSEEAQAGRVKVNFGPREAKMMANLVAKYNSQDDMLDAVEGLNISDNIKLKFRLNIYQLYNNLKANAKVNNENKKFLNALAQRESTDDWRSVNQFGYIGKYGVC